MRGGDPAVPIIYQVERMRDGASFATRRVVAIQHGHVIFSLEASFQMDEEGFEHQMDMPSDLRPPDASADPMALLSREAPQMSEAMRRFMQRERPFIMIPVDFDHYTSSRK